MQQGRAGNIEATLIPGDGIGPEVVEATVAVLDALRAPFAWDVRQAGMASADDPLPEGTLESIRRTGLALKGRSRRRSAAATDQSTCAFARNSTSTPTCAR